MYVVELLLHDTLAIDHFRMNAFLPDLINAVELAQAGRVEFVRHD